MAASEIVIRGAAEHNLKRINLTLPRNRLIVITGVSGSGKSSLAFDTLYAEGQRRYVESLSAYARQFLEQMEKPDVESIEGLSPAISIEQRTTSRNPRSTVGTVTEVYDYLRLLFARIGRPHCHSCGRAITSQSVQQIVDAVLALPEGSRIQILAPIVRGRKGIYKKELREAARQGFVRARVDGEPHELDQEIDLDKQKKHTIEIVVDRLVDQTRRPQEPPDRFGGDRPGRGGRSGRHRRRRADDDLLFSRHSGVSRGAAFPSPSWPRGCSPSTRRTERVPDCDGIWVSSKRLRGVEADPATTNKLSLRDGALAWGDASRYQLLEGSLFKAYRDRSEDRRTASSPHGSSKILWEGCGIDREFDFRWQRHAHELSSFASAGKGILSGPGAALSRLPPPSAAVTIWRNGWPFSACPTCDGSAATAGEPGRAGRRDEHQRADTRLDRSPKRRAGSSASLELTAVASVRSPHRSSKRVSERLGFLENVGLGYLTLERDRGHPLRR